MRILGSRLGILIRFLDDEVGLSQFLELGNHKVGSYVAKC